MDVLATVDDVSDALLRPLTDDETFVVMNLITKASALLRSASPGVDSRIQDGSLDQTVVATVVGGVVARFINNPQGVSARSQAVGPYNESLTYTSGNAAALSDSSAGLTVTAADLAKIAPYQAPNQIGSIKVGAALAPRLTVGPDGRPVRYGLRGYPDCEPF